MLQQIFFDLCTRNNADDLLVLHAWIGIQKAYQSRKRFYHTLHHLENLYAELQCVKDRIADWDTMLFTLFYHDIVYKVPGTKNEEASAEKVVEFLQRIGYVKNGIDKCRQQIIATKKHEFAGDMDTSIFLDADLSILGKTAEAYAQYAIQIRKEFSFYPDIIYKPGRIKVLQHFLQSSRIYKTGYFVDKYEEQARVNLQWEIAWLS